MAGLTPAGGHEILFRLSIFPQKEDGKELRPCLVSKKFKIFHHIESYGTCMEH